MNGEETIEMAIFVGVPTIYEGDFCLQKVDFVIEKNRLFFPTTAPPTQKRVGKVFTKKLSFLRRAEPFTGIKDSNRMQVVEDSFFIERNDKNFPFQWISPSTFRFPISFQKKSAQI